MSKHLGDIGEISFLLKAKKSGLSVSRPYTSDASYDFITDYNGKLNRVQIKSSKTPHQSRGKLYDSSYKIISSHGASSKKLYDKSHCDVIACYIAPLDIFYLINVKDIKSKTLNFYPERKDHRFSKYFEYWELLK